MVSFPSALAVSVNTFSLDKSTYNPGDSGKATLIVYNDQGALIRITSVDMSFNYFFQDGLAYSQSFVVNSLSMNVSSSTASQSISVPFSLPSDVAGGYFIPSIQVTFNQLTSGNVWSGDRQANLDATKPLNVQSQYYTLYQSATTLSYLFIALAVVFLGTTLYFAMRYWTSKKPNTFNTQSSRQ